jgi:hypothetical protein
MVIQRHPAVCRGHGQRTYRGDQLDDGTGGWRRGGDAWRWRWWLGAAVSAFALTLVYTMCLEITDPSVGPAIRKEAGQSYITQYYWSAAAAVALHMIAVITGLKARRRG